LVPSSSSPSAPTTTVVPSMATEMPKESPFARSEDVSLATCPYVAPPLVVRQIKAAPAVDPVVPLSP
jgi:hypothetical protein